MYLKHSLDNQPAVGLTSTLTKNNPNISFYGQVKREKKKNEKNKIEANENIYENP